MRGKYVYTFTCLVPEKKSTISFDFAVGETPIQTIIYSRIKPTVNQLTIFTTGILVFVSYRRFYHIVLVFLPFVNCRDVTTDY